MCFEHWMHRDIDQIPLRQSTERHHSIIDWISREFPPLVRRIEQPSSATSTIIIQRDTHSMIRCASNIGCIAISIRDLSNNQVSGTIPSSIGSLTKLSLLYVLAHTRWKTCAHTSSSLSMGVLLQHRDLANNHLESPLPSFLQTKPAIDTLDLRNNSFVREICSWCQMPIVEGPPHAHIHARRRARSQLGVTTSLEVVCVSHAPRRPRRRPPFQDGQRLRCCSAGWEW